MDHDMKNVDLSNNWVDPSKDYRIVLPNFKIDSKGNLLCKLWGNENREEAKWDVLIAKERLEEEDWLSHMAGKGYLDFKEFVFAYLNACRLAGIKTLNIVTRGFDCKYSEEEVDEDDLNI